MKKVILSLLLAAVCVSSGFFIGRRSREAYPEEPTVTPAAAPTPAPTIAPTSVLSVPSEEVSTYRYGYKKGPGRTVNIYDRHGTYIHQLRYDIGDLGTGDDFGKKAFYMDDNLVLYICPFSSEGVALYSFSYDENGRIVSMLEKVLDGLEYDERFHVRKTWVYDENGYTASEYYTDFRNSDGESGVEYLYETVRVKNSGEERVTETCFDRDGNVKYIFHDTVPYLYDETA